MPKSIPKTRYHLQQLTRRIEKLEKLKPFSHLSSGTGVRAAAIEAGNAHRLRRKAAELKHERALVEAGLLEIERKGNQALYRLTHDGMVQTLKDRILLEKNDLFEDECCFVIFDVPEDVNRTRKGLRRFLKQVGFTQLQKSVWMTTKNVAEWMMQLVEALGLQKWVAVVVGQKLGSKSVPTGT